MSAPRKDGRLLDVCACLIANYRDGDELTPVWWRTNAPDIEPATYDEIAEALATMRGVVEAHR